MDYQSKLPQILRQYLIPDVHNIIYEYSQYYVSNNKDVFVTFLDLLHYIENLSDFENDKLYFLQIDEWIIDSVLNNYTTLVDKIRLNKLCVLSNSMVKSCVMYYILFSTSWHSPFSFFSKDISIFFDMDDLVSLIVNQYNEDIKIYDMKDIVEIENVWDIDSSDDLLDLPDNLKVIEVFESNKRRKVRICKKINTKEIELWNYTKIKEKLDSLIR